MSKRGTNPNSHEALRRATAMRKKNAKAVKVTWSPEAIAFLDGAAEKLSEVEGRRVSRSELTERLALRGVAWLVEAVREDG